MHRRTFLRTAAAVTALGSSSPQALGALLDSLPPSERMPALFIGHGSPMNAIEDTAWSRGWKLVAESLPRPVAILVVSAHWLTPGETRVAVTPSPRTIHDFRGFPEALRQQQYAAPGAPAEAEVTIELLRGADAQPDPDWGLDHGTWSILLPMFPEAEIPVFQLSVDYAASAQALFDLAIPLHQLRDRGVLIIGSGNIVHNLRRMRMGAEPFDWALEFEDRIASALESGDVSPVIDFRKFGKITAEAHPTHDHFLPALYPLALRQGEENIQLFNRGIDLGSISMLSFQIG